MPRNGVRNGFLEEIENRIAEVLAARESLIELEAFILANRQYGRLSDADARLLLDATDSARRGVQVGLYFGRLLRNPPPDLDSLRALVDAWDSEGSREG